jgi:hypothetical protein
MKMFAVVDNPALGPITEEVEATQDGHGASPPEPDGNRRSFWGTGGRFRE